MVSLFKIIWIAAAFFLIKSLLFPAKKDRTDPEAGSYKRKAKRFDTSGENVADADFDEVESD
ncbi:MAG: hypothetical protein GF350_01085 [Chitinivibrionales bacterium]|nr:hypothetical protein [Chitinivibrionales bacterium]